MARARRINGPPEARFWPKVDVSGVCWEWTAAKQPNGYGRFGSGEGKVAVFAHRWAYEYLVGPILTCNRTRARERARRMRSLMQKVV